MHIAIAGNIGSGKTTLTTLLARRYGWTPHFETVKANPYLADFYRDPCRWAFNLEVFFLKERFRDALRIAQCNGHVVQDRTLFEGVHVFTATNYSQGHLSEKDFRTYMELFGQIADVVGKPDLLIYLKASVPHLVKNIQKRGRDYEQGMPIEYLQGLNDRYNEFIFNRYDGKVMVVEADEVDFLSRPEDFDNITARIDAELFGIFEEEQ